MELVRPQRTKKETSMKYLNKLKVSYQGISGAYSHLAIKKYFRNKATAYPCPTFKSIFKALINKKCKYAMLPVENSIAGKVGQNYDLIKKYRFAITGEINLRIHHQLLVVPLKDISQEKRLKMIKKACSHPVALAQCQGLFKKHPWIKPTRAEDTAGSAKDLAKSRNKDEAAIASIEAAKIYKLEVLKKNIESSKNNFTRFLIIKKSLNT